MKTIAESIRDARINANYTQKQAANYLGITDQAISNYEKGKNRICVDILVKLCDLYQVDIIDILCSSYPKANFSIHKAPFSLRDLFFLKRYQSLDTHSKKVAEAVLDLEVQRIPTEKIRTTLAGGKTTDDKKELHAVADHYGLHTQTQKTVEEIGGLLVKLGQLMLGGESEQENLALLSKMVDVQILLEQLEYLLSREKDAESWRLWKIREQLEGIENTEN